MSIPLQNEIHKTCKESVNNMRAAEIFFSRGDLPNWASKMADLESNAIELRNLQSQVIESQENPSIWYRMQVISLEEIGDNINSAQIAYFEWIAVQGASSKDRISGFEYANSMSRKCKNFSNK